ncbi:hypothetical protein CcaverHIS002_0503410 [Cutaneotrichosporon cavernicola]|uniref:Uncharacterized protein n=1 Tax=Cutaneotrichosporon cavernicola TaxID=279322 RepID=A0AA48L6E1_9TREE|nr:uncharacterized protein CcaverHIS019_0503980 [Cutaneotrichosporon cavernicola]BEI84940.1 hypothetical protein CcaverHIS002_0503410 [Cutaneotrichosporon cavernicola]BEI92770.1 hypothetical protein CcaverHIS019_0503980 [Cutaneotrichosporon cavernicola]BEJ00546.1 hypothetical protein CcaverHIS631_0504030 [Cutaneotrichosporon cavernicola]BEJ08314.1 hypothetical protein CcaverHIS641_0503990 [Cutaneotrichosporon cavernicola]
MCPGTPCCGVPYCDPVWVNSHGTHTDWVHIGGGHHFRAHENRTASGRVVHTHEARTDGFVNMRYESSGDRQQWVIDASTAPGSAGAIPVPCRPLSNPAPASVAVPALVPVTTHTHTHTHTYPRAPLMCGPLSSFCSWIKPDGSKAASDAQAAKAQAAKAKVAADALAAKAKRDAAAKELADAKAHYEAILTKIHEGKKDDEWARYWADLGRYYNNIGHQTEAKGSVRSDWARLGAFDINNFWGYPKS